MYTYWVVCTVGLQNDLQIGFENHNTKIAETRGEPKIAALHSGQLKCLISPALALWPLTVQTARRHCDSCTTYTFRVAW